MDVASLNALENKNVITRFPSLSSRCTTVQVLKSPKTDSSIRTLFLPKTVAEMLVEFKAEQDMTKEALGAEPEMPHQTAQSIPENSAVDADAAAALTKLLANPSMAELIKNLAKSL